MSTISGKGFSPSGIAPIGICKIWTIGGAWGLIVEIDLISGDSRLIGQLPSRVRSGRLEPGPGNYLLAWSQGSTVLGWIDTRTATFRPITPPSHPWVGPAVGPSVPLGGGTIAVAPIGQRTFLRSPRPWREAPLIWLLDGEGGPVRHLGQIPDMGGDYLSAAWSQVRVGKSGDTILVVHLSDATLDIIPTSGEDDQRFGSSTLNLPWYLRAPRIWEDVWEASWLINGAQPRVYHVPQLAEAAFAPDGRLFVVRNGAARWNNSDSPLTRGMYNRPGGWEITDRWVEVFDPNGVLLGAYSLPGPRATRLVADGMGQLYFWGGDGTVSVVRDPNVQGPCPILPRLIEVPYVDSPYETTLPVMDSLGDTTRRP